MTTQNETKLFSVARFLTGSRAYGYATSESDYDYRCLHVAPLHEVASGLYQQRPKEGAAAGDDNNDDTVSFELGHFVSLLLKGSPNNVELLFLPNECVLECHDVLTPLFEVRHLFLNAQFERALAGYCVGELKAAERDLNLSDDDPVAQTHRAMRLPKRLAHCFRLLEMGIELKEGSKTLQVHRPNADMLLTLRTSPMTVFGGQTDSEGAAKALEAAKALLGRFDAMPNLTAPEADLRERLAHMLLEMRLKLHGG